MWTPLLFLILALTVAYTLYRVMELSAQMDKRAQKAARLEIQKALKRALED